MRRHDRQSAPRLRTSLHPTSGTPGRHSWLATLAVVAIGGVGAAASARADDAIVVPRDYPTLQAAVNAASPGARIRLRRGAYVEEVVIAKSLTIEGDGVEKTVIQSPATLTSFGQHLFNGRPVVSIVRATDGAQVAVSGLTITGPTPCAANAAGIRAVKNARLHLANARVTSIGPADTGCDLQGTLSSAVVVGLPSFIVIDGEAAGGSPGHARVTGVAVDRFLTTGVAVLGPFGGPVSTAVITDNQITGGTPFAVLGQNGVSVSFAATAQVARNVISGTVCSDPACGNDPINTYQSSGIGTSGLEVAGTVIEDNVVSGCDVGIYVYGSAGCCATRENRLRDNRYFGIAIQDGSNDARENRISGGEVGIGVIADAEDTTAVLRDNQIRGTTVQPIREISCCGVAATAIVRH